MEDPFSVLSFFVPEPQTRPHLVPLYQPLLSPPPSTSNPTSLSTSDAALSHPHTSRTFPSTTALPLDYTPATLSFLYNLNPRYQNPNQKQPTTEKKKPIPVSTSRRRHWTITRNYTSRQKGKEKEDDHLESVGGGVSGGGFGGEVPAWQVPREAHAVDFGCLALLEAEMEAEMRRRRLGVGVNGIEGATDVNGTTGNGLDGEEKEDDDIFGLIRSSLDYSQVVRNVGGGEDGLKVGATTAPATAPTPMSSIKAPRTGANLLSNTYWTTQRAAEAENYIRDMVYGGVDGLAYVRSLAEFVGDSGLHQVRVFFKDNKILNLIIFYTGFRGI